MTDMSKYVLKNKRLSKTKTVFIFRRNYLNINDFVKKDDCWVFEEKFNHFGNKCYFRMLIHGRDIFSMYEVNTKSTKVKGNKNCFGVFIRDTKKGSEFQINRVWGNVEFLLCCTGKRLAYDNGKGIRRTREEKLSQKHKSQSYGSRVAVTEPNYISWGAAHPFQGGGVSPR